MAFHDEVEIEDFEFDAETDIYTYPCPCGDLFTITKKELQNGEDIARCPSCSLIVKVIYNLGDFLETDMSKNDRSGPTRTPIAAP